MSQVFLIDGIDRLGKSSLIKGIQDMLGYHLVVHYDKPKKLEVYESLYKDKSLQKYQFETNQTMFNLIKSGIPLILDRTHLGEMVYAPLYRKYAGDYVYEMELEMLKTMKNPKDVRLILLTSSNCDMLVDDGLSFDPSKKHQEQELFKKAFNKSQIPNKIMIDVHNNSGGYRPYNDILLEAIYGIK